MSRLGCGSDSNQEQEDGAMICAICQKAIGAREAWTENPYGATYHNRGCPPSQLQPVLVRPVIAPLPVNERQLSYPAARKS
jgi:hypothetical protein